MLTTLFYIVSFGVLLCSLIYFVVIFNSLIAIKNNIERAESNINVLLKQRFDEIPQLINVCKGYIKYEGGILEKLAQLRGRYFNINLKDKNLNFEEKTRFDEILGGYAKELNILAEAYPNLKASEQFLNLQNRLSELEMQIADRRELFNNSIGIFNSRIGSFPDMIVAKTFGYKKYGFFEIDKEERGILDSENKN